MTTPIISIVGKSNSGKTTLSVMCEARDKNYKITSQEHKKIIP